MSAFPGSFPSPFPFPDRVGARQELSRDLLYAKIPAADRERIADAAWETGAKAALDVLAEAGAGTSMRLVAQRADLRIERRPQDHVVAGVRYFSEYWSGRKTIVLYAGAVARWAEKNALPLETAEELILAHEFFHHLECARLGLTSRQYTVPTLRLGPLVLARSGIRALSEIGAHAFARTYFDRRAQSAAVFSCITQGEDVR